MAVEANPKKAQLLYLSIYSMLLRVTVIFLCRYVNGKTYMEDVADALEEAKEEIFITDWW